MKTKIPLPFNAPVVIQVGTLFCRHLINVEVALRESTRKGNYAVSGPLIYHAISAN